MGAMQARRHYSTLEMVGAEQMPNDRWTRAPFASPPFVREKPGAVAQDELIFFDITALATATRGAVYIRLSAISFQVLYIA